MGSNVTGLTGDEGHTIFTPGSSTHGEVIDGILRMIAGAPKFAGMPKSYLQPTTANTPGFLR